MLKNPIIYIVFAMLLLTGCTPGQEQKDITDVSVLQSAEELEKSCPYFQSTVSPLTSDSKEITVQYKNTGDTHLIYIEEGDFFASYDGVSINGQHLLGKEKQTRIVLFPGTYRMCTQVEEPRNSKDQNNTQTKFENVVEIRVEE